MTDRRITRWTEADHECDCGLVFPSYVELVRHQSGCDGGEGR